VSVEYPHRADCIDFVMSTLREARAYIAEGAINGVALLEQAGLTTAEAEAEVKRIEASHRTITSMARTFDLRRRADRRVGARDRRRAGRRHGPDPGKSLLHTTRPTALTLHPLE